MAFAAIDMKGYDMAEHVRADSSLDDCEKLEKLGEKAQDKVVKQAQVVTKLTRETGKVEAERVLGQMRQNEAAIEFTQKLNNCDPD